MFDAAANFPELKLAYPASLFNYQILFPFPFFLVPEPTLLEAPV